MNVEEVYHCGRCGLCLKHCPVYQNLCEESLSPRGKVQLTKYYVENEFSGTRNLKKIVSKCLMCGSCTVNCPSGIQHDLLFMRMRSQMNFDYGLDWKTKMIFFFLTHEQQMRLVQKITIFGYKAVFKKLLKDIEIGHIPFKKLPKFNNVVFRDQIHEVIKPQNKSRGTVLYFTGCATNFVFEDIGKAVVNVISNLGYRVKIPKDQVCCGFPMFSNGEIEKAKDCIIKNINLFNQPNIAAVLVDCATCGSALKSNYGRILKELDIEPSQAEELATKVYLVSDFLFEHLNDLEFLLKKNVRKKTVTYHLPCHIKNAQKRSGKAEQLLKSLSPIIYIKTNNMDSCCGGGGTFRFNYPDISKKIAASKIKEARSTKAQFWATDCPGCFINLSSYLLDKNDIRLIHPAQIVDMCLQDK